MQNNAELAYVPFSDSANSSASLIQKKKPRVLVIIIIVFGTIIATLVGVLIYLFATGFFEPAPPEELSDADFLTSQSAWEKLGAPTVIWSFASDNTGELTTNKSNYYKTTWTLTDSTLNISTAWLYLMEDSFTLTVNREANTFTVQNLATDEVSVFTPLGSSATSEAE